MLELVLIVCLSAQPDRCEQIYLVEETAPNMMQCLMSGPTQAAKWAETHPGYVVRRWTCGRPRA